MPNFRKKSKAVQAVRWDGGSFTGMRQVQELCDREDQVDFDLEAGLVLIETPGETMVAHRGDWVIRGINGQLHPCKADVFVELYEPVSESLTAEMAPKESK